MRSRPIRPTTGHSLRPLRAAFHILLMTTVPALAELPQRVYLDNLDGTRGFTVYGVDLFESVGTAVTLGGDLDNDGIDDVVIGAAGYDDRHGGVEVTYGSSDPFPALRRFGDLPPGSGFFFESLEAGERLGASADTGDFNGDGVDDLLVGGPSGDPYGKADAGRAYVLFGRPGGFPERVSAADLDGTTGAIIAGVQVDAELGGWVANVGDLNHDGIDDLGVGAEKSDVDGREEAGALYVFFGVAGPWPRHLDPRDLNGVNGFVVDGEVSWDHLGVQFASAGDVDGDGIDDLAVGLYRPLSVPNTRADQPSFVVFGRHGSFPPRFDPAEAIAAGGGLSALNTDPGRSYISFNTTGVGDFNGDGFDDFLVGESYDERSWLVHGRLDFDDTLDLDALDGGDGFEMRATGWNDFFGSEVTPAGDLDKDGFDDLLVGAFGDDTVGYNSGATYLLYGRAEPYDTNLRIHELDDGSVVTFLGEPETNSGGSLGRPGDVNDDAVPDVIIGASSYPGRAYVAFGSPSLGLGLSGTCPGITRMTLDGGTPYGEVALLESRSRGTAELDAGPCAGRVVDLDAATELGTIELDAAGRAELELDLPPEACPILVQALDETDCRLSNRSPLGR